MFTLPSLIVLFTLNIPSAILSESSLSFLSIGIKAPQASWGLMVNAGRQFLYSQPWLSLSPSVAIMVVVLAFNFLGDGLREAQAALDVGHGGERRLEPLAQLRAVRRANRLAHGGVDV